MAVVLGALELLARAALPAAERAPPCWLERRGDGDAAELVVSARAPLAGGAFRASAWKIAKAPGCVRVVCLGDSTVHGHPFDPPAPFADWLAVRLPQLLPGRSFEVLNLGVNGMNAEAVADLAAELAPLAPDLAIVYVGHNEFLDQHLAASLRPWSHAAMRFLARSAAWRWLAARLPPPASDAMLSAALRQRGALDREPLLPPEARARGLERYEENLRRIVAAVRAAGATPALCRPICDLKDTPPQRSSLPAAADPAAVEELRALLAAPAPTRDALAAAALRWPGVAAIHYALGRAALAAGDFAGAWRELAAARDQDGHPVRATSELLARIDAVAAATGALRIDPWPALAQLAPAVPGQDGWFVDYVHPDLRGHEFLADAILDALAAADWLAPRDQWRFASEPDPATYRERMGLSAAAQATSLARRGLFALGQGYLDPASDLTKGAADAFARALALDPGCALGHTGQGALHLLAAERDAALASFARATAIDATALDFLREAHAANPGVRELFARAGLTLEAGQIVPLPGR